MAAAADPPPSDAGDNIGVPRLYGAPVLFAIARDPSTVFVSWNIDWPSVFETAMPADRRVHLRLFALDGIKEKRVVVEPMSAMHFITTSGLHASYRVEIGYYQPADAWHSVAVSNKILMPTSGTVETPDIDLATIPFHLRFQQLVELFAPTDQTALAKDIAQFQKRASSSGADTQLSRGERKILREVGVSRSDIASVRRLFHETDTERLARRARAFLTLGVTSPARRVSESS